MTYDKDSRIETIQQVKDFLHYLIVERQINFVDDDNLGSYGDLSVKDVKLLNDLMDQCSEVCEAENADLKELAKEVAGR